ncbi:ester cyclase [Caulobacter hibisci]|uniref:Ester cyclase n=1 Tax=Caulobacter hibisci TaxID=2035993 RepID=A0ABS0T4S7_9CAUL|nr:ester cyclase [Caulobacter hibisci]MBI1686766.1 ester cyclase [Caulobacter hibisci]
MDIYISPDDLQYSERARGLIRIGRDAVARSDDAALDRYFSPDYVLHGPGGDVDLAGLKAFFAVMRSAFSDFACERVELVEQGDVIAARTVMTGLFTGPLPGTAVGTIHPTGQPMRRELLNLFRYDADGRLAEEWVQYDDLSFLKQLGVEMAVPSDLQSTQA